MNRRLLSLLLLSACVVVAQEEVFPPEAISPERYAAMKERSPFVLPTKEEEPKPAATWSSDYQIVSVLKLGAEQMVLVKQASSGKRIPIRAKENAYGLRLVELRLSANPSEVSAVIALGESEGEIRYDPAILSALPRPSATDNPALKSE